MSRSGTRSQRATDEEVDDSSSVGVGRLLGGLGLLAVLAGVAMVVVPDLAAEFSVEYFIVVVTGGLLTVLGIKRWTDRFFSGVETATMPVVEERTTIAPPGAGFDANLRDGGDSSMERVKQRSAVRNRLRAVASEIVADRFPERDVETELSDGTWTDDPVAGALFAEEDHGTSIRNRVSSLVARGSSFERRVDRAIAALQTLAGDDPDHDPDGWTADPTPEPTPTGERATGRWNGLSALGLTTVGLGVVFSEPALVLGGGVLAGFGAYVIAGTAPNPALEISRTVEPVEPRPEEAVTVRIEIENVGDSVQPDLRFVDGVPAGVTVVDGSPRHGTSLKPGASSVYSYEIEATRGTHEFEPAYLVARNLSGTLEGVSKPVVDGDETVVYDVSATLDLSVPLRTHASKHVGRILTDVGGSGIEFHSVREYRTGDPLSRVDWNRAAQGGELATLQFREERSATVVVLIDARTPAYVAPDAEAPSAVDRSVMGAAQVIAALLASDDVVGLSAISSRRCWLEPSAGHTHRARAQDLLATHEAFAPSPPDTAFYMDINLSALRKRLPGDAQLVVFSPVADDEAVGIVRQLQASGYPVTLVSPDATTGGTPGRRLARLERGIRLSRLRRSDVRVVDWDADDPLALAITNAARRWS